jgi:signal transduction histidine kinase
MRSLYKDFLLRFSSVCLVAFLVALPVTYFNLRKILINEERKKLNIVAKNIISHIVRDGEEFREYITKKSFKDIEAIIESENKIFSASFITLLDEKGKVIKRYSDVTGDNVSGEEFFKVLVNNKKGAAFFHVIDSAYLERELLTSNINGDKAIIYSVFLPVSKEDGRFYLWYGNIIFDKKKYFNDLNVQAIDGVVFWDGKKILNKSLSSTLKIRFDQPLSIKEHTDNIDYFVIEDKKFLFTIEKVSDFNNKVIGSFIVFKDFDVILVVLYKYTAYMFIIYAFSSFIGITFIGFYFKRIKSFIIGLKGSLKEMEGFSLKELDINGKKHIIEFVEIEDSLKKLFQSLKNQKDALEDKIESYIQKYFVLYKAIRELDSKQTFVELIDVAVDFLKENTYGTVLYLNELETLDENEKLNFEKISYFYDGKEYGICIERDIGKKSKLPINFIELYFEVFRINFERIANFRALQKSYSEVKYFSDLLLKLLQKHNTNEIFMYLLEKAKDFCKSDSAYIGIFDKKENVIRLQFFIGVKTEEFKTLSFPSDKGLGGYVLKEKKSVFVENYFEDSRIDSPFKEIVQKEALISVIATPIIYDSDIFGILYVAYRHPKKDVSNEIDFLEKLAYVAALALEKDALMQQSNVKEEELRKAYEELVSKRKELNALLKNYKETNIELERVNRELNEQYDVIKKSYEELEKLNRAKDVFLGILSHELKTPIAVLKGYIDTLSSITLQSETGMLEILSGAKKAINNLWQIVEDLLDYSRMEMGKISLMKETISSKVLVNSIIEEVSIFLKEREQTLKIDVPDELVLNIDKRWIKRAIVNLIINAIKFSPNGKPIFLTIRKIKQDELIFPEYVLERPSNANEYYMIEVRDEGVGINFSEINRIFEKFYEIGDIKEHTSGKYKFMSKGLGLGLSFTKRIVNLHGGVIFAESKGFNPEVCPGSTFKIYLPVESLEIKSEIPKSPLKKKTIVVIESEYEISSYLEMVFSSNYNVIVECKGGSGYLKVLELQPSIVFINVNLKGYTGYEICSMIKEDKKTQHIPVVLYSTGVENFDEVRAQSAKADMFFSPLFDVENLVRIVNYYANKVDK